MERALVAVVLVALVAAVAFAIERRRRPDPPTQARWRVPGQLDRADFSVPDAPWLAVVFTSATCGSCERVLQRASVVACADVAFQEVAYQDDRDLHDRYGIEAVPCFLLADSEGVVRVSFVGVPTATDLWAAVAEARYPGSSPEPDLGRVDL